MEDLSATLRRNEVETLLRNARLTRDWPDGAAKCEQAKRQVLRDVPGRPGPDIRRGAEPHTGDSPAALPGTFCANPPPPEHDWQFPVEEDMIPGVTRDLASDASGTSHRTRLLR